MVRLIAIIILVLAPFLAFAERPDLQISPKGKPNASQFGLMRGHMQQLGWTPQLITNCVGSTPAMLGKDMDGYNKRILECISALPKQ